MSSPASPADKRTLIRRATFDLTGLPPAPQEELEGMIVQFEALLDKAGYFFPESRAPATRRTLRNLLTKPGWNHLEVRTLRGILSSLADPHPR